MPPAIPVEAEDFVTPPNVFLNADWNNLLWAAMTVGRPNRYYVFRHGMASAYEAIFRTSLIRMAVAESFGGSRLLRTGACKSLDPSEKGAVNYFLGLTLCKLFADQNLGTPWLLHLDVFRNALNPQLSSTERSRPDLVGEMPSGDWLAFEAKGRVSPPDADTKDKAKTQARRVVSVMGRSATKHFAGISYFKDETLRFYVRDPDSLPEGHPRAIAVKGDDNELYRTYYQPFTSLALGRQAVPAKTDGEVFVAYSEEIDAELRIHSLLVELASREQWGEIKRACTHNRDEFARAELHADGLQIKAGASWARRIKRSDTF